MMSSFDTNMEKNTCRICQIIETCTVTIARGDIMDSKWKDVLCALILGLICPGVLVSMIQNAKIQSLPNETLISECSTITETVRKDSQVAVLTNTGEIISMEWDEYITGVVLCEMPVEFEAEALKAQAVVARTYALRRISTGGKHIGADVCTDPSCCQGYRDLSNFLESGGTEEQLNKVENAVISTNSQVLLYNGEPIEATYFSCSGGRTEDALAVWGAEIPYLRATDSPGEEKANHYTDTVHYSGEEFLKRLGLSSTVRPEGWVEEITYTEGGGVKDIRICGQAFSGTKVRQLLGLRSTAFVISVVGEKVTITTKGFGHRVGMSQYGAEAMAVAGSNYKDILNHYYQGTSLSEYSG